MQSLKCLCQCHSCQVLFYTCQVCLYVLSSTIVLTVSALCVCIGTWRERTSWSEWTTGSLSWRRLCVWTTWNGDTRRAQIHSLIKTDCPIFTHPAHTLFFCYKDRMACSPSPPPTPHKKKKYWSAFAIWMYSSDIVFSFFSSSFVQYCMFMFIRASLIWKRHRSWCFSSQGLQGIPQKPHWGTY